MMDKAQIRPLRGFAIAAVVGLLAAAAAGAAMAQEHPKDSDDVEPWRPPAHEAPRPRATSSIEATKATPAEQQQTRLLASALFAKAGAAQRAADKAAAAQQPAIQPAEPKPEWLGEQGVHLGGQGVAVTKPF